MTLRKKSSGKPTELRKSLPEVTLGHVLCIYNGGNAGVEDMLLIGGIAVAYDWTIRIVNNRVKGVELPLLLFCTTLRYLSVR